MKQNLVALMGLSYLISFPVLATDSHCREQENIIFSCSLGKNIVSVCASKDISQTSGYLQYRFGQKNTPELILPASIEPSHHADIQARTLMFSGGGGAYLRFINGQFNYIVYTAIGKGWGTKDGVAVEKDGKHIANLKCRDIPISKLGDDFFTSVGLMVDQEEFLLP
ncbi:MAG: hypothetical protein PHN45_12405 [Methylococcales bacterium]|nr:hypothetical protein [Methylococcales bacterium]MDD5755535.1 hypothetical protein [Methylococcales bacterium]